jgi:hypothetical protein
LFARFEWQRLGKLHSYPSYIAVNFIDSADFARAGEAGQAEGAVRLELRHAETRGHALTGVRTTLVVTAGKRRALAGYVNHLTLKESLVEILREPDGPMITKSAFFSSLGVFFHFPAPLKADAADIDKYRQPLNNGRRKKVLLKD